MTLGRHLVVSLVALATAAFAAGCGGDDGGNDVMRATLTGDGCRYQGDTTPAPGPFTVEVRNQTSELANFQLIQLPEGTKPKDIEGWFNKARQQYEQTGRFTLPHIMWVSSTLVSPMRRASFPAMCLGAAGWPSSVHPRAVRTPRTTRTCSCSRPASSRPLSWT